MYVIFSGWSVRGTSSGSVFTTPPPHTLRTHTPLIQGVEVRPLN